MSEMIHIDVWKRNQFWKQAQEDAILIAPKPLTSRFITKWLLFCFQNNLAWSADHMSKPITFDYLEYEPVTDLTGLCPKK